MRRTIWLVMLLLAGMMIVLPWALVEIRQRDGAADEGAIRVYLHETDRVLEMRLEDYLIGVLAAEIPASFHEEALKAQAVAARTYAHTQMKRYGGAGYRGADISTDYRIHQAYLDEDAQRAKWKDAYDSYHAKLAHAVRITAGEVMTYDGKLIRALYHSMCGGRTASAQEVWDTPLAYLVSVECRWDDYAPHYREEQRFNVAELGNRLGSDIALAASANGSQVVTVVNRTESNRADLVRIGENNYAGSEVRAKLGLRSANFTVQTDESDIVFTTVGYGHGVGMCQYGAGGMARAGYSYRDILAHYYRGVKIGS